MLRSSPPTQHTIHSSFECNRIVLTNQQHQHWVPTTVWYYVDSLSGPIPCITENSDPFAPFSLGCTVCAAAAQRGAISSTVWSRFEYRGFAWSSIGESIFATSSNQCHRLQFMPGRRCSRGRRCYFPQGAIEVRGASITGVVLRVNGRASWFEVAVDAFGSMFAAGPKR